MAFTKDGNVWDLDHLDLFPHITLIRRDTTEILFKSALKPNSLTHSATVLVKHWNIVTTRRWIKCYAEPLLTFDYSTYWQTIFISVNVSLNWIFFLKKDLFILVIDQLNSNSFELLQMTLTGLVFFNIQAITNRSKTRNEILNDTKCIFVKRISDLRM